MTVSNSEEPQKVLFKKNLDHFYLIVKDQVLKFQHPISGLFPLNPKDPQCKFSHVRDSVYCATVLWALHRAFARVDDDAGRHYELGQCAVKCMRGILIGWMQQSSRLEQFKKTQSSETCLSSRLDYETGEPIVDPEYKNLQMDCVGLYVIQLAQMIASGLQVVYTRDEVAFMQNLVFYLERAYRIPDYGMWERGTKQNRNMVELNASSIGMAKAALESVSGLNVYGAEGSHSSTLLMDIDAHSRNRIIMTNLLPRESASKGSDVSLLPALCWPAYGASKTEPSGPALERCLLRLKGQYGFRRFNRDGYATVLDQNTHYQPGELMKFTGIESEWPMFFAYMAIEHCMNGELEKAMEYDRLIQPLLVHPVPERFPWLPKFFYVPLDDLEKERRARGSVVRKSSFRFPGESFFLWGQSVYIISQLLIHGCLTPSDLDPLGRCPAWSSKLGALPHSSSILVDKPLNLTIQVVLISESARLQQILATYGIITQTPMQVEPIQIWPPDQLVRVGKFMGCSQSLGLTGRPPRPVGQLGTSRFYRISGLTVLCYPLLFEAQDFYLLHDMKVVIDEVKTDFRFLSDWWRLRGRPTFCFLIKEDMVKVPGFNQLLRFLISMKNGNVHGIRIVLGRAQKFVSSGCVEHLDFLPLWTASGDYFQRLREVDSGRSFRSLDDLPKEVSATCSGQLKGRNSGSAYVMSGAEVVRVMHAMDHTRFHDHSEEALVERVCHPGDEPYALAERVAALQELLERHDLDYVIVTPEKRFSIRDCLSDLSRLAGIQQAWCVVRLCASLLAQFVNSLAPSLSIILVCGKQITVGVAQGPEVVVNKPLNPNELYKLLRETVYPVDPVQFSLQQELILWVSSLLTSDMDLFNGIKFIRLGWLLEAMKLQLERETLDRFQDTSGDTTPTASLSDSDRGLNLNQRSLGACHLYSLPPCMVKDLLFRTLRAGQSCPQSPSLTDSSITTDSAMEPSVLSLALDSRAKIRRHRLRRRPEFSSPGPRDSTPTDGPQGAPRVSNALFQRQLDGCLGRVPPTFYEAVYNILERSPHGVLICNQLLSQKPTLTDMTAYDLNFIDEVEWLLRPIGDPAYRSLFVETVMVIAVILKRNSELSFKDTVDIKVFIQDAMIAFSADHHGPELMQRTARFGRRLSWPEPDMVPAHDMAMYSEFASTPANVHMGTTAYLAKAALDRLLQGHIDLTGISKDACCTM
ncbi:phosphorylase kinase alpha/beta subunit [Clonorchis sinensis]|uniref:Phosphorylase b kinase regulatory subunit n=1 Tax=Clonorchis sinensis TaxID=79923 RepID=G7YTR8_CLOSI|nr:phosphorylase kinase alpha/beta subunit [Clonorchis sinensis]